MSTALEPALYNSMKESVGLAPELMRNSLILTELTLRTFSLADSVWNAPLTVHEAFASRSPLKGVGPEVTVKVALTLSPGAIGAGNEAGPEATAIHPAGTERLRRSPATGAPVVFRKVTVESCEEAGANVGQEGVTKARGIKDAEHFRGIGGVPGNRKDPRADGIEGLDDKILPFPS